MSYDNSPATKGDVDLLKQDLEILKQEILRHFDVVAEQLQHDVLGAFRDFTVLQDNKHRDHERRISRLEGRLGVTAA